MLGLCDRFRKLPSEILAEDASLVRLLQIETLGAPEEVNEEYGE